MAYRRSLTARGKLLYEQRQRFAASFACTHRDDDERKTLSDAPIIGNRNIGNNFQGRFFRTGNDFSTFSASRNLFQDRRFVIPVGCWPIFGRYMSSVSVGEGAVDKIEIMSDVAEVFGENTAEVAAQAGPMVNEVAIAAADSYFPVAVLQYLTDYVHSISGFNWWASIVLTTILIRSITLPLMINQLKATSKFTLLRPRLEEIKEDMQNRGMSPSAVAEGQAQMQALFKEYGVTPFTPMKGLFIQGPIFVSFFLAIRNMVEKVPSFKQGGAFWFTDLTTPDSMYIFPVLTALTFWITVECNAQEGLEGNPAAKTIKNVSRVFAALSIPFTAGFPKARRCGIYGANSPEWLISMEVEVWKFTLMLKHAFGLAAVENFFKHNKVLEKEKISLRSSGEKENRHLHNFVFQWNNWGPQGVMIANNRIITAFARECEESVITCLFISLKWNTLLELNLNYQTFSGLSKLQESTDGLYRIQVLTSFYLCS